MNLCRPKTLGCDYAHIVIDRRLSIYKATKSINYKIYDIDYNSNINGNFFVYYIGRSKEIITIN